MPTGRINDMPANLPPNNLRKGKPSVQFWIFMKLVNSILANWKTTLAGVVAVLTAVMDGITFDDLPAIIAGIGLILGKDSDKSNAAHPVPRAELVE